jgi:hypothetical protein
LRLQVGTGAARWSCTYQKLKIRVNFRMHWNVIFWYSSRPFCIHTLWSLGIYLVYFWSFGVFYQKIWQPWLVHARKNVHESLQ